MFKVNNNDTRFQYFQTRNRKFFQKGVVVLLADNNQRYIFFIFLRESKDNKYYLISNSRTHFTMENLKTVLSTVRKLLFCKQYWLK